MKEKTYNIIIPVTSTPTVRRQLSTDARKFGGTMIPYGPDRLKQGVKISFLTKADYNRFVPFLKREWGIERKKIK